MTTALKTTKDKILDLLKKEAALTVNDLIGQLGITHMAIRKHLSVLEKDGLIQSVEIRQPKGRPLYSYSLTEKGDRLFPKNYEGISVEFLQDIEDSFGKDSVDALFKKREQRLTNQYREQVQQQTSALDKVREIEKIQNEKGYMAKAQQLDENTFELIEYNCPILAIANNFKTACKCETEMFKKVLDTEEVNRVSCKTEGNNHCRFLIKYDS
ncbi:transcriptional regulator [Rossellomorea vietnamensis]|uniref:Transcriptional regulator n=1 Tax=Rossellomorea vietnamensis TaxID=218284 RepID=A0A5D4M8I6_9BACI|nr:metalloregulator ArsR/SmtB family transcription factor [Rossellomorea vietnamensis]TYR97841.1 transcriptional regulator [Rossellomorea vietnamensis]